MRVYARIIMHYSKAMTKAMNKAIGSSSQLYSNVYAQQSLHTQEDNQLQHERDANSLNVFQQPGLGVLAT